MEVRSFGQVQLRQGSAPAVSRCPMAIAVNCPSCKNTFTSSEASADGPFQCPHCGALVAAPGTSVRQAVGASRPHPPKGARPQLLDRLPPSPVASPAFVLGAGAFVLAYGVVMTIVLSGARDDPATAEDLPSYDTRSRTGRGRARSPSRRRPPIAAPKPSGATPKPKAIPKPKAPDPKKEGPGGTAAQARRGEGDDADAEAGTEAETEAEAEAEAGGPQAHPDDRRTWGSWSTRSATAS